MSLLFTGGFLYAQDSDEPDELEALIEESESQEEIDASAGTQVNNNAIVIDKASIPDIFVAADMVGEFQMQGEKEPTDNQFLVREVEYGFSGAIDHFARGTLLIAMHSDGGDWLTDLHELYFDITALPDGFGLKLGRFYPELGRLNGIHRHDWHFTKAPRVHRETFNSSEGLFATGAEFSWLLPLPFYQEVKLGAYNGQTFGHVHSAGTRKPHPMYTGRLKNFAALTTHTGLLWGMSYIRYPVNEDRNNHYNIYGLDVMLKYKRGRASEYIWASEIWYRDETYSDKFKATSVREDHAKAGAYSYVQLQWHVNWQTGFRFDAYRASAEVSETWFQQSLWVTYRPSEFSYFRLTAERSDPVRSQDEYAIITQADFILGHHPAHKF